jgi:hypothetical protein
MNAPGGPRGDQSWVVWDITPSAWRCPSDPGASLGVKGHSYVVSVGDTVVSINSLGNTRGMFGNNFFRPMRDVTDGLSNTVVMSEICSNLPTNSGGQTGFAATTNGTEYRLALAMITGVQTSPAVCRSSVSGQYYIAGTNVRGRRGINWIDGPATLGVFSTVLPPNSPACAETGSGDFGDQNISVLPPNSRHTGGVHCLFGDGTVRFISDNIDGGDASAAPMTSGQSPYGVWGALGTVNGGEAKSVD